MSATSKKRVARQRRHARVRKHVRGTLQRPRLVVYRSNAGIYAQVVDDGAGHTLAAASSLDKDLSVDSDGSGGKVGVAGAVGKLVADRAKSAGIESVVFDRGGNRYSGRVKALADGARQGGLHF
ncbi:MAG: 50S ribosomal protein L18 [Actinomycetota bacterium]|jgi:large subunit ribosomal protein L18|nr:50S ribosomal protein L18 [Euzebyales bacterium]MDQ3529039.1 50S ribosomal protein L18 [Actinomycetota bacterium]